jgi:hypothetical protein
MRMLILTVLAVLLIVACTLVGGDRHICIGDCDAPRPASAPDPGASR